MQMVITLNNDIAVRLKRQCEQRNDSLKKILNETLCVGLDIIESSSVHQKKTYRIKPVSLGAKLPNLDNVAEILAATEGEMYK